MGFDAVERNNLRPAPIGVGFPREDVVGEFNIEDFFDTHLEIGMGHRNQSLDPIVQVAPHHVGRTDAVGRIWTRGAEAVDA